MTIRDSLAKSGGRKVETLIYAVLWVIILSIYLLDTMRERSYSPGPLLDLRTLIRMTARMAPLLCLFLINNCLLIPRLLLRNHLRPYFLAVAAAIAVVFIFQYINFVNLMPPAGMHPPGYIRPPGPHHVKPLIAMPVLFDITSDVLVVGVNLSIALLFQRIQDSLERKSLEKANAESRLNYLKQQISPHFYMNMLNNIHGMIEINPVKAQDMVLDMSRLMRYMLYDSSRPMIALSAEIDFLKNYLNIMRQRFPESKVKITFNLPPEKDTRGISIPPLLFLVFIENAFKHGVSYRSESFVSVAVTVSGGSVGFKCLNSIPETAGAHPSGIGLHNVEQRLKLLYGDRYTLRIADSPNAYSVNLTIPIHESKDTDN